MKPKPIFVSVVIAVAAIAFVGAGSGEEDAKPFPSPFEIAPEGQVYPVTVLVHTGDRVKEYFLQPVRVGELHGQRFLFGTVLSQDGGDPTTAWIAWDSIVAIGYNQNKRP